MGYIKDTLHPRSIIRKVLAALLLAFIAVIVAQSISRFSFRELVGTVEELSAPNEKLSLLNSIFHELTALDQLQRAEAITNPRKPYDSFLDQSAELNGLIDSLAVLAWDSLQHNRLMEMKNVLAQRNKLFFSYLKVKAEMLDNRKFSVQLDTLAAILTDEDMAIDSSLITTRIKTITTYLPDTTRIRKKEHRSFFRQLFGKKEEPKPDTPQIRVEEHYTYDFDTLATARQVEALLQVERIMRELEAEQRAQQKRLERQELDLIQANSAFISQLLNILNEVENEELERMRQTNVHAVDVMNQSMARTNLLLIIFGLSAAFFFYLVYIDVSRSNYYKKQLEAARDRAEELGQIKQRFLANMSHEIRTPLQSIIGFAELLKNDTQPRPEAAKAIHSASEHLLHIVNEVLDYSRISSGNFTLDREPFELIPLVREVESAMRMQAEQKQLNFILDLEKAADHTLIGDPFRLRQILYNLLSNAVKFTNRGFVRLAVKTHVEGDRVRCVFVVADSGIGMTPDELERVFNQFEQGNAQITRQYGGTGLGLSIVKSLVDAQGGTLEVDSKPGYGSTFSVSVEFSIHTSSDGEESDEQAAPTRTVNARVIVVDDDPLILRLCSLILEKHNIPHKTFQDAKACLEEDAYDQETTHIFLDIRMPTINGIELCHRLKKIYGDGVQFIALTAHVLKEERESILAEGFDTILSKPFRESELLKVLEMEDDTPSSTVLPDLSTLRQMTLNDQDLLQSVIAQFIEETVEDLATLRTSVDSGDAGATREIIHRLAGRLSQVGFKPMGSRFSALETALVGGTSVTTLQAQIGTLMAELEELMAQLRLAIPEHLN